ncbi:MAG: ribonuclease HI [Sutterellaceae bacterium]|nr:ribonuclease HI [Sutterellaceae bacterium]MDD7441708.1 ribonuclease HI [Sutterellaceae bacterium]MDY2868133.1 ribonuclease HI [Mesosutterella sp.]
MDSTKTKTLEIWTDGACKQNPGPGGWGAHLVYGPHTLDLYGGEAMTTNNRMELTAVIVALSALKKPCEITVHLDSQYVKNGIEQWLPGWIRKGWKTASGKPVKNEALWKKLSELSSRHSIRWLWVKGHAGNPGNERADELANWGVEVVRGEREACGSIPPGILEELAGLGK